MGYDCDQPGVPVEIADEQVVTILKSLQPPEDWRKGVTRAVGELLGEQKLEERLEEIRDIIKTNRKKPQVQPRVPDFENVQSKVAQTWRRPQT